MSNQIPFNDSRISLLHNFSGEEYVFDETKTFYSFRGSGKSGYSEIESKILAILDAPRPGPDRDNFLTSNYAGAVPIETSPLPLGIGLVCKVDFYKTLNP